MPRRATGSVYYSDGSWYLALTLDKRRHFRLSTCKEENDAKLRQALIVDKAIKLKQAGKTEQAIRFCMKAACCDDETLVKQCKLMDGVIGGNEHVALPVPRAHRALSPTITLREFCEKFWTNNELARRYRKRVREIDHSVNIGRLEKYVYPVVFEGRTIGDTPMNEFTIDHADHILAQSTLPEGSIRHVVHLSAIQVGGLSGSHP